MKPEKKRLKEIDDEMVAIKEAMAVAKENNDLQQYQYLLDTYDRYLAMQLNISDSKKDKAGNKLGICKLVIDLLGILVTGFVGILGIRSACQADEDNVIVNQRSWNLGTEFLKKLKR